MATTRWKDAKHKLSATRRGEIAREVTAELIELDLREIRETLGKSQVEVAHAAEMAQSELSRIEHREDYRVSTLRRVVEALGGELELVASFGNRRIRLRAAG